MVVWILLELVRSTRKPLDTEVLARSIKAAERRQVVAHIGLVVARKMADVGGLELVVVVGRRRPVAAVVEPDIELAPIEEQHKHLVPQLE